MKFLISNFKFLVLILISIFPLLPLLHPGLPLTHDGQDHVARIANFYQSLSEGNLIPRWAENLNWGYGHPILMFLYPLPSYFASFCHLLGFGLVDSVKIVFGLSFILSGLFMYIWLREFVDDFPAILGSILYLFAPYRFVDFYVRGAIGEHLAFVFPPLICFFLLKLSKGANRFYFVGAALSLAGLILAHNAISLMFMPFLIFYAIYLSAFSNRKKLIYEFTLVLILGFTLSAFFWLPAFLEGKYTLRDIIIGSEALSRFIPLGKLIYSPWSFGLSGEFSVQVGIFEWIAILASIGAAYKAYGERDKRFILILGILTYFIVSIFMMLPESKFIWTTVTTLEKFQFPWRFLSVSLFAAAVLGALTIRIFPAKIQIASIILILIFLFLFEGDYFKPKGYLMKPESFYSGIYYGTTDTGESSPVWSVRFMEHPPRASAEVIKGSANIKEIFRNSTTHSYEITAVDRSQIRENTLYFPGWRIYIDGKRYEGIQFQDPNSRGLMTFYVKRGMHRVEIKFGDTILRTVSAFISLAAISTILVVLLTNRISIKIRHD